MVHRLVESQSHMVQATMRIYLTGLKICEGLVTKLFTVYAAALGHGHYIIQFTNCLPHVKGWMYNQVYNASCSSFPGFKLKSDWANELVESNAAHYIMTTGNKEWITRLQFVF